MSFEEKDGREMDAAVERVLAGLRETRVPEGLEERVAAAVRLREAETVSRGGVRGWVWTAATVAVAACVMTPMLLRSRRAEVAGAPEGPKMVSPEAPKLVAPERRQPVAEMEAPRAALRKADVPVRARPLALRRDVAASGPMADFVEPAIAEGRVSAATRVVDAEALAEAMAPSRVAPPEPLTAQEQRLRRVAMQGTAEQRAALNPVARQRQFEQAKAAVMEFFEPPRASEDVQE